MTAKDDAQQVLDRLRESLKRWPGAISAVERDLGKAEGYFRGRWRAGAIQLETLLATLEIIDEDPVRFFQRALEGPTPDEFALLPPARAPRPEIVERAYHRLASNRPPSISHQHLENLDDLRFEDPARAGRMVEDAIDFVDPTDLPMALGIWASSGRLQLRLDEGQQALRAGYEIAGQLEDPWARANMVQRAAYLLSANGDYAPALRLAERAMVLFSRLGDDAAIGRTLVDQANFLFSLDLLTEAERSYSSALRRLPESERRNQCAANYGLALCRFQNDPADANSLLAKAASFAQAPLEWGQIRWLEACLATQRGELAAAESSFSQSVDHFLPVSPVHAALACCDRIRMHLSAGWLHLARRSAFDMVRLLEPLEPNPIAQAAVRDLVCCRVDGHHLTPAFLEGIRKRIEGCRRRSEVVATITRFELRALS